MGRDRRAASAARCAEGAPRRHAARRQESRFVCDPSNRDPRFERARVRGSARRARRARTHARSAGAFGAALAACARGARCTRRETSSPRNSETSEAGYALIDQGGARSGAAGDRAPRAGAVDRRGGRRRDAVAACQARSVCSPPWRRIPARRIRSAAAGIEPMSGRLGIFREVRGKGLPVTRASARDERHCCGTIASGSSFGPTRPSRSWCRRSASPAGARSSDRSALASSLPRLAGRTLPACWRGECALGTSDAWAEAGDAPSASIAGRRFVSAGGEAPRNGDRSSR